MFRTKFRHKLSLTTRSSSLAAALVLLIINNYHFNSDFSETFSQQQNVHKSLLAEASTIATPQESIIGGIVQDSVAGSNLGASSQIEAAKQLQAGDGGGQLRQQLSLASKGAVGAKQQNVISPLSRREAEKAILDRILGDSYDKRIRPAGLTSPFNASKLDNWTRGLAAEDDQARLRLGASTPGATGAASAPLSVKKFKSHPMTRAATVAPTRTTPLPAPVEQQESSIGSPPMNRILGKRSPPWATLEHHNQQQANVEGGPSHLPLRVSVVENSGPGASIGQQRARSLLMPINELRVSGSKLEPPSRPSVDWSKQKPYFGPNIERSVSVELGKTAHLACKVFDLGDKTVSWLRPRENEILTAGKYTYIGDSRISSMNENGSNDWILEIKDVGLNDSTSYECQVSTDPKMSVIINLHVLAARAHIKQSENNYYPVGANIEFTCDILPPLGAHQHRQQQSHLPGFTGAGSSIVGPHSGAGTSSDHAQQIYWYHDGNLINYARTSAETARSNTNFTIDWDPMNQMSRLKLYNIRLSDSGNYTCKPTSAEPATVKLFVKKQRNNSNPNRVTYSGDGYHLSNGKGSSQRNRQQQQQHYGLEASSSVFDNANSSADSPTPSIILSLLRLASCLWPLLLITCPLGMPILT